MSIENLIFDDDTEIQEDSLQIKYLSFFVDNNLLAVPIFDVVQIISMQEITPVPEFPGYAKGIINIRGCIIPVIDVRLRLKKPETVYTDTTCIIIINVNSQDVGIIVDSVSEVLNIPFEQISPPPSGFVKDDINSYLIGVAEQKDTVILIINSEKIVYEEDKDLILSTGQ